MLATDWYVSQSTDQFLDHCAPASSTFFCNISTICCPLVPLASGHGHTLNYQRIHFHTHYVQFYNYAYSKQYWIKFCWNFITTYHVTPIFSVWKRKNDSNLMWLLYSAILELIKLRSLLAFVLLVYFMLHLTQFVEIAWTRAVLANQKTPNTCTPLAHVVVTEEDLSEFTKSPSFHL